MLLTDIILFIHSLIPSSDIALLATRLVAGGVMVYYGKDKVRHPFTNAKNFTEMGFKPGWLFGTLVLITEFFGGAAVIIGVYADVAAILIGFHMIIGTVWKIKMGQEFGDFSYDILVAALALIILSLGTGMYALGGGSYTVFR